MWVSAGKFVNVTLVSRHPEAACDKFGPHHRLSRATARVSMPFLSDKTFCKIETHSLIAASMSFVRSLKLLCLRLKTLGHCPAMCL